MWTQYSRLSFEAFESLSINKNSLIYHERCRIFCSPALHFVSASTLHILAILRCLRISVQSHVIACFCAFVHTGLSEISPLPFFEWLVIHQERVLLLSLQGMVMNCICGVFALNFLLGICRRLETGE